MCIWFFLIVFLTLLGVQIFAVASSGFAWLHLHTEGDLSRFVFKIFLQHECWLRIKLSLENYSYYDVVLFSMQLEFCDDACVARYLRARGNNARKAAKMLRATINWREKINMGRYLTKIFFNC